MPKLVKKKAIEGYYEHFEKFCFLDEDGNKVEVLVPRSNIHYEDSCSDPEVIKFYI